MKREYIGIHLGKSFISAARIEGRNLAAFAKLNLSSLKEESSKGILQEDVLWEALINKALREVGAEHNEVFVSLEDREFIFRSFDMPLISKKEIESSMNYEIEKYIPFKMEELIWDYSCIKVPKYKKINLSFIGMKSTSYKRYKTLFTNTDANILNMEPSAISLARVVKSLKSAKKIKNFAVLDFSEGESYVTFFYNDLPVFNRFLGSFEKNEDETIAIDRLVEEIRISVRYFRREFKNYDLNNLFILCSSDIARLLSSLKDKIDIELVVLTAEEILHVKGVDLEHLKAYATAAVSLLPFRFKPKFQSKDELAILRKKTAVNVPSLNYIMLGVILVIGAVACVFLYSVLNNKLSAKDYRIERRVKNMVLPSAVKNKSVENIEQYMRNRIQDENSIIDRLKVDLAEYRSVYPILEDIPKILTEGLWLSDFRLRRNDKGKLKLAISGYVLLTDKNGDKTAIDKFIMSLKDSGTLSHYFHRIDLVSMGREKIEDYDTIKFSLNLE